MNTPNTFSFDRPWSYIQEDLHHAILTRNGDKIAYTLTKFDAETICLSVNLFSAFSLDQLRGFTSEYVYRRLHDKKTT